MLRRSARGNAASPHSFADIKLNTTDICGRNDGIMALTDELCDPSSTLNFYGISQPPEGDFPINCL